MAHAETEIVGEFRHEFLDERALSSTTRSAHYSSIHDTCLYKQGAGSPSYRRCTPQT